MRINFATVITLWALLAGHFASAQLVPFKAANGLYGYKDAAGNVMVTPKFKNALSFLNGYAAVVLNDKLGLIDSAGKEVVYFDKAWQLNQQLISVVKDNKIGLMDIRTGKVIQHPRYRFIDSTRYPDIPHYLVDADGKIGFVEKTTGIEVFPPVYDSIKIAGFYRAHYYLYRGKKIKLMDGNGKPVPGTYDRVTRIQDESGLIKSKGKYWYLIESEGNSGLMSLNNTIIVPPRYSSIDVQFEGKEVAYITYRGKHGMINSNGEEIIKPQYDRKLYFGKDGISAASLNGRYGYIDNQGNIIIPFAYEAAGIFSEGLAAVKFKNKYGFIDKQNKWIIPGKYEAAEAFYEGLCPVKKNGKWGYINRKGKTVISHKFKYAGTFSMGRAIVTDTNGRDYYIDTNGKLTKR